MARVQKVINHNAVLVLENSVEKIVLGKGMGFGTKTGEKIVIEDAEKVFSIESKLQTQLFSDLLAEISVDFFEFMENRVDEIASTIKLSNKMQLLLSLTDHLHFALERDDNSMQSQINTFILPELKLMYAEEYDAAVELLKKVNEEFDVTLDVNEVGFIALHIINCRDNNMEKEKTLLTLDIFKVILEWLDKEYSNTINRNSIEYNRLLIHIQFLCKRIVYGKIASDNENFTFSADLMDTSAYQIAVGIKDIIEKQFNQKVGIDEVMYLSLHLNRIGF